VEHAESQELADLFTDYGRALARRARALTGSEEDAEDAVQEVMLHLVEAPHLLASVERIGAWLFTVVARRCVDLMRSNRRRRTRNEVAQDMLALFQGARDPLSLLEREEVAALVARTIDELPEPERRAFVQNALEGVTFREMSERSGVPKGTLMARKKRAMDRIRGRLRAAGLLTEDA
jgi:RNA polymerase sigma factor (sigma-70 family)